MKQILYDMGPLASEMACLEHPIPQGFSSFLSKPYIKAVTHFCEVEWWRTLMVECLTIFLLFDPTSNFVLQMGLQSLPTN